MLSPTRVIGHKEYGNRPPGGRPGRKGDPEYDMDWRRSRVASFTPRNVAARPEEDVLADPMIVKQIREIHHATTQPVIQKGTMAAALRQALSLLYALRSEVSALQALVSSGGTGSPADEVVAEIRRQLEGLQVELRTQLGDEEENVTGT